VTLEAEPPEKRKTVFKGSLKMLAVPELLQFFARCRRTGTLLISTSTGLGVVEFVMGMIAGATSPGCNNIGALLRAEGLATEEQAEAASRLQADTGDQRLMGAILLEQGLVTPEALRSVLERQVMLALREMTTWSEGAFAFSPESEGTSSAELEIRVACDRALLEVFGGD